MENVGMGMGNRGVVPLPPVPGDDSIISWATHHHHLNHSKESKGVLGQDRAQERAGRQAGRQVGKQTGKQAGKQASNQASRQASKYAGMQVGKQENS